MAAFGKEIMKKEFLLNSEFTFLNHASFGNTSKKVSEFRTRVYHDIEEQPDVWFREKIFNIWNENVDAVCNFVNSQVKNLVLIPNTDSGMNCILRSLKFNEGDGVLASSWSQGLIQSLTTFISNFEEINILLEMIDIPYPLKSVEQLINCYEQKLRNNSNIKLVVIDYISSMPSALFPLNELIKICKKFNKIILVDGTDAPGHVKLDLQNMGCDFFVGSLHKWAYASTGCALMWISDEYLSKIYPNTVSIFNPIREKQSLNQLFFYQGTCDYSSLYTSKEAIQFYNDVGGHNKIHEYCFDLANKAIELLLQKWNTEEFFLPTSMKTPFIRLVKLPNLKKIDLRKSPEDINKDLSNLMDTLWKQYKIQSFFQVLYNSIWCRVSINIYNQLEDYERLANAIVDLIFKEIKII